MYPIHVSSEKQAKNQGFELFIKAGKNQSIETGKDAGFRSVHRNRQRTRLLSRQRHRVQSRAEKGSRDWSKEETELHS